MSALLLLPPKAVSVSTGTMVRLVTETLNLQIHGRSVLTLRVLFMTAILSALLILLVRCCCCWLSASLLFCIYSFRREATDVDIERMELSRWG